MAKRLLIIMALIALTACEEKHMKKYEWIATMTTPKAFPAFVAKSSLTLADGKSLPLFNARSIRGRWGHSPYLRQVGQRNKHLPTALDVTWLSYAEDQLYQAHCPFQVEKLQALFDTPYSEPWWGDDNHFSKVTVGVAPGGNVSVWLQGGKATVLIAACKASKVDLPWDQVYVRQTMTRKQLLEIHESNYDESDGVHPFGTPVDTRRWDEYNQRYSWQPALIKAPEGSFFGIGTYSAEFYLFDVPKSPGQDRNTHGVPEVILIYIEGAKDRRIAKVTLDEEEAFKAFQKFEELSGGEPFRLEIEVSQNLRGVALWLKTDKHVLLFERTSVEVNKIRRIEL